jgi:hypothetical protein
MSTAVALDRDLPLWVREVDLGDEPFAVQDSVMDHRLRKAGLGEEAENQQLDVCIGHLLTMRTGEDHRPQAPDPGAATSRVGSEGGDERGPGHQLETAGRLDGEGEALDPEIAAEVENGPRGVRDRNTVAPDDSATIEVRALVCADPRASVPPATRNADLEASRREPVDAPDSCGREVRRDCVRAAGENSSQLAGGPIEGGSGDQVDTAIDPCPSPAVDTATGTVRRASCSLHVLLRDQHPLLGCDLRQPAIEL